MAAGLKVDEHAGARAEHSSAGEATKLGFFMHNQVALRRTRGQQELYLGLAAGVLAWTANE